MLEFLPGKPFESEVCQIAVQLLGPDLVLPDPDLPARSTSSGGARACGLRTRGVYNTLPKWEPKPDDFFPGGAHQEGHPFQLGAVAYVAPVVADGGGFHVVSCPGTAFPHSAFCRRWNSSSSDRSPAGSGSSSSQWPKSHRMLWKTLIKEYSSPGDGKGGTDTGPDMKLMNCESLRISIAAGF